MSNEFNTCSYEWDTKPISDCDCWKRSDTTDQTHVIEDHMQINLPVPITSYHFESSLTWSIPHGASFDGSSVWGSPCYRALMPSKVATLGLHLLRSSSLVESETNDLPKDSQITFATEKLRDVLPKPLPVISGTGAEKFQEELETMEYPEHIKSFYKDAKKLVQKLGLFP